jgi:adenosylhomocysteine nucleosidase
MRRIAIVAALEREVSPLVRGWKREEIPGDDGRRFPVFENDDLVLICGGIGAVAGRRAGEFVISRFAPQSIMSIGFAGGLDPSLGVGAVVEPRFVINAADGSRIETGRGEGTLVSFASVAGREQKRKLREAYGAVAVDMEAAAVAQAAMAADIPFAALKAISDASDVSLPTMDGFVSAEGQFRAAAFGFHAVLRPWLWAPLLRLAGASARASRALSDAMSQYLARPVRDVTVANEHQAGARSI